MRIQAENWYPSYLNPDFSEILELANSGWDTCRILVNTDNEDLVIASGYGNTHDSICNRYFLALGAIPKVTDDMGRIRRWSYKGHLPQCDSYILYHKNGIALLNLEDVSGKENARLVDNLDLFGNKAELIKDLIRESGLAL